jgi:hypothetical protein
MVVVDGSLLATCQVPSKDNGWCRAFSAIVALFVEREKV